MTAERLQQLALMVHSPQFVPESVQGVSRACESLCLWVKAVFQCCCMQRQLELKQQMEATARHTRAKLNRLELQKNEAKRRQEEEKIQQREGPSRGCSRHKGNCSLVETPC